MATSKQPVAILPPGTIVIRQARGNQRIQDPARIIEAFTVSDKLGRRLIRYRVQFLESGLIRDWPGSHCQVVTPPPASA